MTDQPFLPAELAASAPTPTPTPTPTPGTRDPLVAERYATTMTSDPPGAPAAVANALGARPGSDLSSFVVEAMLIVATRHEHQVKAQMTNLQATVAAKQTLRRLLGQVLQERSTIHGQGQGQGQGRGQSDVPTGYPALVDEAQHLLTQLLTQQMEMNEVESLRLQEAMDRMSKMISTLSNLLKKIDDTEATVIQNLK